MSGCYTYSCNRKRKSAAIADKGRILGVSDMLCNLDDGDLRAARISAYTRLPRDASGSSSARTCFFPKSSRLFPDCDAVIAICLYEENVDFLPQVLMRAFAFCYGLDICLCGAGIAQVASTGGELSLSSPAPNATRRSTASANIIL